MHSRRPRGRPGRWPLPPLRSRRPPREAVVDAGYTMLTATVVRVDLKTREVEPRDENREALHDHRQRGGEEPRPGPAWRRRQRDPDRVRPPTR
ncbi:MAG: hypothetical protein MZW92_29935 [Comamonadaceae bacterium]|nr:hypothetical protein [Comamonadaceae bacterium]